MGLTASTDEPPTGGSDLSQTSKPSVYLAGVCFGGLASAGFMRGLLSLRAVCAARGVPLQVDLGGGEALAARARAGMLSRFLEGSMSHLVFADAETPLEPEVLLALVCDTPDEPAETPGLLVLPRALAARLAEIPERQARIADVRGARGTGAVSAAMVFDDVIDPVSGRLLTGLSALRWRLAAIEPTARP